MTVPSLLRDIACKAVDDDRPRTTRLCRKRCEDRDRDVVKNIDDGRMVVVVRHGLGGGALCSDLKLPYG